MKPVMRMLMILIYALCLLTGCGGGNDVVSDDTSGILSIESVNVPAQSGGSGTVSVKLVAPKGGPGSGTVAISATESSLIAFSPTSQSVNSNGTATFYFTTSEVQADTIVPFTVSIGTLSISKQITLKAATSSSGVTVTSPAVNSISFVSASPTSISLKGAGGAGNTETSIITFLVKDVTGQPLSRQTVDFTLDTSVGGLSLIPSSAVSDVKGAVKTIVNAGITSTPVKVTATVRGTSISSKSDQLIVSTGLPSQDGFSVSIEDSYTESFNKDGVKDKVTARLSDHFHNPVPDGTAVYFTTSGGSIEPSCTTVKGVCSVTWTSQAPRPANGRAVVLAYAIGEEAFIDLNGNGVADAGEFTDTAGAFRDDNENGIFNAGETYIPFNSIGIFDVADGKYNGILQGSSSFGAPKSKHIYYNSAIVMASSLANVTNSCGNSIAVALGGSTSCTITVSDKNNGSMPVGTTVAFSYTDAVAGITLTADNYTVTNDSPITGEARDIFLRDDGTAPFGRGTVTITIVSPSGITTPLIRYDVN
ncbi:MAG: hypothetical protein A2076_05735 [Geobacteraceae bacterium GWC2_53_11]|nr:MAG: hypothetical protein A2076_05735 [Geobacteraceae bacterium GWC2_53_11]